jgi:murein DD-endopeptidase MepM/ murein hydrolase activator NlpD
MGKAGHRLAPIARRQGRLLLAAGLLAVTVTIPPAVPARASTTPALRLGAQFGVPLYGTLVKTYDAPLDNPYAAGHRADNIAAPLGTPVRASADGVVSFAGNVAGNLSVSVDHTGGIKTTYSYLGTIVAKKNQSVHRGDVVGTVGPGHDPSLPPNVQLSARRNGVYFDPLELYVGSSYADLVQLVA